MDIDGIRKAILENVAASPARLTPRHLEKTILETYGIDKTRAKSVLKDLVAQGQLEYTYEFGSTYLVRSFDQVFLMVIANLRYPSLKNYYPQIIKLTDSGGWVVLSGLRLHERDDLMDFYTAKYFKCFWTAAEKDWAVIALKKK